MRTGISFESLRCFKIGERAKGRKKGRTKGRKCNLKCNDGFLAQRWTAGRCFKIDTWSTVFSTFEIIFLSTCACYFAKLDFFWQKPFCLSLNAITHVHPCNPFFAKPFKMHFSSTRFSNTHRDSQEHVFSVFPFLRCCCWCCRSEAVEKEKNHIRNSRSSFLEVFFLSLEMGSFNNNIPIFYVEILYKYWYLARCISCCFFFFSSLIFFSFFLSLCVRFINKSCLKMNKS